MATQLQIRRGTTSQMNAFTGAEGELAVNTTTDTVHVHDGSTAGGFALAKADGSNIGTYAGSFTTLAASGAVTLSSTLAVSGTVTANTSFATGVGIIKDIDNNSVMIGAGAVNLRMIDVTGDIRPVTADGLGVDATIDLGDASTRFKDVYLSGTATMGGLAVDTTTPFMTFRESGAVKLFIGESSVVGGGGAGFYDFYAVTGLGQRFFTNNLQRMTITSAGNVGIGVVPTSAYRMQVNVATNTVSTGSPVDSSLFSISGGTTTVGDGVSLQLTNISGAKETGWRISAVTASGNNGDLVFNGYAGGADYPERMRINAAGQLLIGTTTGVTTGTLATSGLEIVAPLGQDAIATQVLGGATCFGGSGPTTSSQTYLFGQMINSSGSQVGSISVSHTATAYNTSSDQRLKENIADADDAGSKIDSIQVRKFDWIADGLHQDFGMIAQELQAVAPEAVSAPEDTEEMMGVDYSKLVPMLVKEIQSLRARVNALETE
jgi:hypothetical protein